MSLSIQMKFFMGSEVVYEMPVTVGDLDLDAPHIILDQAMFVYFFGRKTLTKVRPEEKFPEWDRIEIMHPAEVILLNGDLFFNVVIWDGMLESGVDAFVIIDQVTKHLAALKDAARGSIQSELEFAEWQAAILISDNYLASLEIA